MAKTIDYPAAPRKDFAGPASRRRRSDVTSLR
jgi:hypothetical protein